MRKKEILEQPANFKRICFCKYELVGKWRDGTNKFKCIYCGDTY